MTYEVKKQDNGYALCEDGKVIDIFESHAKAWKVLDRLQGEPINKSEQRADWYEKKNLDEK